VTHFHAVRPVCAAATSLYRAGRTAMGMTGGAGAGAAAAVAEPEVVQTGAEPTFETAGAAGGEPSFDSEAGAGAGEEGEVGSRDIARMVTCYCCGRGFSTASLPKHIGMLARMLASDCARLPV
jgi:hypothetical protein